ncbi:hypothetical protein SASPL_110769 [Salvia splendens]|uniref:Uncharacterized protein n=1 Tax=Salvia splendens TaxID=180675 RepID=A0A8X8Y7T3_SALSN|nr:hypothetical protein SASPL_110769 [Salvia splendens]
MEAFCVLEFQSTSPESPPPPPEQTDDEDSFFDLVLKSPDIRSTESPGDVFRRGNGFGKSVKCERSESNGETKRSPLIHSPRSPKVTCRDEKTLGTCRVARANSLRSQLLKETSDYENSPEKSSRGLIPKYLKLIRPLYLMVWRRQHEKKKPTESSTPFASPANISPKKDFRR